MLDRALETKLQHPKDMSSFEITNSFKLVANIKEETMYLTSQHNEIIGVDHHPRNVSAGNNTPEMFYWVQLARNKLQFKVCQHTRIWFWGVST